MSEFDLSIENHPRLAVTIEGHKRVIDSLQIAHQQGKLPHGLLFVGDKGVGKATLAHQIAHALFNTTFDELGKAPSSTTLTPSDRLLRAGNHPDFICLEKEIDDKGKISKDIPVERARSVVHFFSQTSLEGNWRIAIIDSVDDLTIKGANTLLKILEEPPHKCLLILISHNLEGVLPTLRSRSQIFHFSALTKEECLQVFQQKNVEDGSFLSSASAGRPGLGFMIQALGGKVFYQAFLNVMEDLSKGDLRSTHLFADGFVLKNKNLPPDLAWQKFFDFLNHWIPYALKQTKINSKDWGADQEALIAHNFIQTQRPDKWVNSWFQIQEMLKTSHIYSLDKKQTLLCIFHELAGLHQR